MRLYQVLFPFFLFLFPLFISAQHPSIISGPFQGSTTPDSTEIWMMAKHVDKAFIDNYESMFSNGEKQGVLPANMIVLNDSIKIIKIKLRNLGSASYDDLKIRLENNSGQKIEKELFIKIPNKEISDFSFLAGSCVWPYGRGNNKWDIFRTMGNYHSDFMMWMGDNVYLLKEEWNARETIDEKYIYYRTQPQLNSFLSKQPNFAAWDDHDFGPNNSGGNFDNKELTINAFNNFWANPSAGTDSVFGTFYSFVWQDAEFFVLDGRYHRTETEMYGGVQMDWLKKGIKNSGASVKFIVGGSQFLVHGGGEDWGDCPGEKNDFFDFIEIEKINGIVFLSGDRHFAELTVSENKNGPDLIEITSSPLTSFVNPFASNKSDTRVKGTLVKKRNFVQIFLEGKKDNRKIKIRLRGAKGKLFWEHEFLVKDLEWD